MTSFLRTLQDQ